MRAKSIAAAIISIGLAGASQAAEVSEQGAKDLRHALTHSLSRDLARSGFVTVKPNGDQYEITYDWAKFFDKINSSVFSVTDLKPLTIAAQPLADERWHFNGSDALQLAIHYPKTDTAYSAASASFDGIFDPALGYMRSLDIKSNGIKFSSVDTVGSAKQGASGNIDSASVSQVVMDSSDPEHVDFQSQAILKGFHEVVTPVVGRGAIEASADTVGIKSTATSLPVKELRELFHFIVVHIKAKQLSSSGSEKFAALVRDALPVFGSLSEDVTVDNLQLSSGGDKFGIKTLNYTFKMDGLTNASNLNFGVRAEHFTPDPGVIPAAYEPFLPEAVDVQLGVPDVNFGGMVDNALKSITVKGAPISGETWVRAIFPSGYATLEFPKLSAHSGAYDIEASGSLKGSTQLNTGYSLQATILARDFDKTIGAVQDAAKTDPNLNDVSFSMLAAKGFAKTDPDGRLRWDVTVDENHTVTVNGQVMKGL